MTSASDAARGKGLPRAGFSTKKFKADHELKRCASTTTAKRVKAIMALPTFEVHGIVGGYQRAGHQDHRPARAEAKLSPAWCPTRTRPACSSW